MYDSEDEKKNFWLPTGFRFQVLIQLKVVRGKSIHFKYVGKLNSNETQRIHRKHN